MNKRNVFFLVSILALLSGLIGYNYIYKNHRNISEEKAAFSVVPSSLIKEYAQDISTTTAKYLDKTIQLKGKVTEIEQDNFVLDDVVVCYSDSITMSQITIDKVINVKGRSIGYDELLDLIKLDQVTIINN
jgi:hypothetical protein